MAVKISKILTAMLSNVLRLWLPKGAGVGLILVRVIPQDLLDFLQHIIVKFFHRFG
jgi:hypothetical protein